jgi:hypothetical protein
MAFFDAPALQRKYTIIYFNVLTPGIRYEGMRA